MGKSKVKEFYEEYKEDIDLVKKHGDLTGRAMARTIERLVEEEEEMNGN